MDSFCLLFIGTMLNNKGGDNGYVTCKQTLNPESATGKHTSPNTWSRTGPRSGTAMVASQKLLR